MSPEDDPTFPHCSEAEHEDVVWCDHRRNFLAAGRDAVNITMGMRYVVPIVPTYALFANIAIDTKPLAPGMAYMYLIKAIPFVDDEELIQIGLWSEGEGRMSMASVIGDWMESQMPGETPPLCTQSAHGFREEQELARMKATRDKWYLTGQRWSLIMDGMCWACAERLARIQTSAATAPIRGATSSDHDPGNFGLNQIERPQPTNHQKNVQDALRAREATRQREMRTELPF